MDRPVPGKSSTPCLWVEGLDLIRSEPLHFDDPNLLPDRRRNNADGFLFTIRFDVQPTGVNPDPTALPCVVQNVLTQSDSHIQGI